MNYQLATPFERIHSRVTDWVADVMEHLEGFGDVTHSRYDDVCNRSYDGFIPYTDGGVGGIAYADLRTAYSSGRVPKAIQPYLDTELKDVEKAWDEEHPEMPCVKLFAGDDPDQLALSGELQRARDRQRESWREKYYDHEQESMQESGTYFYKVRALYYGTGNSNNITGEPEVYFFVGINTDFEYGRDTIPWLPMMGGKAQQTTWTWERTVKVRDCTPSLLGRIMKPAKRALENS